MLCAPAFPVEYGLEDVYNLALIEKDCLQGLEFERPVLHVSVQVFAQRQRAAAKETILHVCFLFPAFASLV